MAVDGELGLVETPVFPPRAATPDFLIVRTSQSDRRIRRPVIAVALVEAIDSTARIVHFRGRVKDLEHLPEYLPLAYLTRPRGR